MAADDVEEARKLISKLKGAVVDEVNGTGEYRMLAITATGLRFHRTAKELELIANQEAQHRQILEDAIARIKAHYRVHHRTEL